MQGRGGSYLVGHGVREAVPAAPVATAHGHDGHLGNDDGSTDGGSHLKQKKIDKKAQKHPTDDGKQRGARQSESGEGRQIIVLLL